MRKRLQRADVELYLVRRLDGRYYATRDTKPTWTKEQRAAKRFVTKQEATAVAEKHGASRVRLVVRVSEEEG